jgi:hypothetical protein
MDGPETGSSSISSRTCWYRLPGCNGFLHREGMGGLVRGISSFGTVPVSPQQTLLRQA